MFGKSAALAEGCEDMGTYGTSIAAEGAETTGATVGGVAREDLLGSSFFWSTLRWEGCWEGIRKAGIRRKSPNTEMMS